MTTWKFFDKPVTIEGLLVVNKNSTLEMTVKCSPSPDQSRDTDQRKSLSPRLGTVSLPNMNHRTSRSRRYHKAMSECCRGILQQLTGKATDELPSWLINTKTHEPLTLDYYNKELRLALVYHGRRHYIFSSYYHQTIEEYLRQQDQDQMKIRLCYQHNIHLIIVPYVVVEDDQLMGFIRENLPQRCYAKPKLLRGVSWTCGSGPT